MRAKLTRSLVALALVAGAVSVLVAPTSAVAMSPCQGRTIFNAIEGQQTVAVVGAYTAAGATDVQLTCGINFSGVTAARFSDTQSGPVAVVQGRATVQAGSYSICYDLDVTYVDKPPLSSHNCP